jgi:hypothetical protein
MVLAVTPIIISALWMPICGTTAVHIILGVEERNVFQTVQ